MVLKNLAVLIRRGSDGSCYDGSWSTLTGGGYYIMNCWDTALASDATSNTGFFMIVGSGDTAVTINDYGLATPITTLTVSQYSINSQTGTMIRNMTYTYLNGTSSNITVKEIGIGCRHASGGKALITRKVLDTPVTIAPGESYTFTYTVSLNG